MIAGGLALLLALQDAPQLTPQDAPPVAWTSGEWTNRTLIDSGQVQLVGLQLIVQAGGVRASYGTRKNENTVGPAGCESTAVRVVGCDRSSESVTPSAFGRFGS